MPIFVGKDFNDDVDSIVEFDEMYGGAGNDYLRAAKPGEVHLWGGSGDDYLRANIVPGTSAIAFGGDGNDAVLGSLDGAVGKNALYGGAGDDALYLIDGALGTADGGPGRDWVTGTRFSDVLYGGMGTSPVHRSLGCPSVR